MDIFRLRQEMDSGKSIYDMDMRVTFYARVSTDKDAQLHSLDAQVRYYQELIRGRPNWSFVEGYVDEGISGTSMRKRDSFMRMMKDAALDKFDCIITKEISRFSRNTVDSISCTQELLHRGVGVIFQSDNINTFERDAELRLSIMSSIAQDEVRKISERVRFGFRRAVEKGVVLGNSRIWGYRKENGRLVVDEQQAQVVRRIFELYASGEMGIRGISELLYTEGVATENGKPLAFSTIRNILVNPKYKGFYCGGKSEKLDYRLTDIRKIAPEDWKLYRDDGDTVPAIVEESVWERANMLLESRSAKQSAPEKMARQNRYSYSGKLICKIHGTFFYRTSYQVRGGSREVWQCRQYYDKGRCACAAPVVYTEELEEIITEIERILTDRLSLKSTLLNRIGQAWTRGARRQQERTAAAIAELERKKEKLLELCIAGMLSDREFKQRNDVFEARLTALRGRTETAAPMDVQTLETALDRILRFPEGFPKTVLEALLDRIVVEPGVGEAAAVLTVYTKLSGTVFRYQIVRRRGKASVCSALYI